MKRLLLRELLLISGEGKKMSASSRSENVKWVDGLRGIASLLVVLTHLTRAFDQDLFLSTSAEGARPRLFQLPLLRVLIQGRIGIPIFSLVTGYVCALKPIRLFARGEQEQALVSITKSAFRRVPRLVLPASLATIIIWAICQFGGFEVTKHVESFWLMATSPQKLPMGEAISALIDNLVNTWTREWNVYEPNQWTLFPLLKGAFLVYMMLFATAYVKPKFRMMVELGLYAYYTNANDPEFGIHFFSGVFLCELSQYTPFTEWLASKRWLPRYLSPILIFIGLILASYPESKQQWMAWSNYMLTFSEYIFPEDPPDIPRFYTGIGLTFIALGIHFSDSVKGFLSHKLLLWLGKNSFAVYLLHGTFIRTALVWAEYGTTVPADTINPDGSVTAAKHHELGGHLKFWFWIPLWFVLLYWLANLWTVYVDSFFVRVTEKIEKRVFENPVEEKPVLPKWGRTVNGN